MYVYNLLKKFVCCSKFVCFEGFFFFLAKLGDHHKLYKTRNQVLLATHFIYCIMVYNMQKKKKQLYLYALQLYAP